MYKRLQFIIVQKQKAVQIWASAPQSYGHCCGLSKASAIFRDSDAHTLKTACYKTALFGNVPSLK